MNLKTTMLKKLRILARIVAIKIIINYNVKKSLREEDLLID